MAYHDLYNNNNQDGNNINLEDDENNKLININQVYKYKNIDITKISILNWNIHYNNNNIFYIQSPIFFQYELQNINSKKYIELKLDDSNLPHIKFLTLVDSIEIMFNNNNNNNNNNNTNVKTQIITNIQNKKSLKATLWRNTVYFDVNKNKINHLYCNKISLLFKLEYFNNKYYSWNVIQILQLN